MLLACTETYLRRFKGQEAPQLGLGGTWEGHIVTQELYNAQGRNTKFIPIMFCEKDGLFVPAPLQSATHYKVFDKYDDLYRRLTSQPLISTPALGSIKRMFTRQELHPLSSLERKQDFSRVGQAASTANETAAITGRLRDLVQTLGDSRSYHLTPTPTTAHIAERLGFESTAPLDEILSGDRPLSFVEATKVCSLFGVNRRWLLEGSEHRFGMAPIFQDVYALLRCIVLDQLNWGDIPRRYKELIFVLPPTDKHTTCAFGRRDRSAHRIDLLLGGVPVYGRTGVGGQREFVRFVLLAAILSPEAFLEGRDGRPKCSSASYVSKTTEEHLALIWGDLHVSCWRGNVDESDWLQDIWDLEYTRSHDYYPQHWRDAYSDFKIIAECKHHITNNHELFEFLQRTVEEIRI